MTVPARMHRFARVTIPASLFVVITSCASVATGRLPTPEPYAIIGRSEALFVFPIDSTQSYNWNVPAVGAVAGKPLFIWDVTWETPETTAASDAPYGIVLIVRWKPGGEQKGSLAKLVSSDPVQTKSSCHCAGPVYVAREDPDLFASVEGGRLVFNIRGSDAIRRILPAVPDSVDFNYRRGNMNVYRTVPVVKKNR